MNSASLYKSVNAFILLRYSLWSGGHGWNRTASRVRDSSGVISNTFAWGIDSL